MRPDFSKLTFEGVVELCIQAQVSLPRINDETVLQSRAMHARAKLKRWEQARNRKPDFKELQAGVNHNDD